MSDMKISPSASPQIDAPGDWYAVDFHAHSPASHDFVGPDWDDKKAREQEAYAWLLEQAYSEKLDVVVITDHNDISGYQKLREMKSDLEITQRTLVKANLEIPSNIQHQVDLFSRIVFLPGVELDTNLGVHYLVVFDPSRPLDEADRFLDLAGYPLERRGKENAAQNATCSPQDVCREGDKIGAIVIAAHIDSTNGIYEATKKLAGHVRIAAFRDDNLFGMEFINPVARDQIESYLTKPDYVRITRIAFVQSSDFHGRPDQKIGQRRTWVRMDGVKRDSTDIFGALRVALRNPDECVSAPGRPEVREIIRKLSERHLPSVKTLESQEDGEAILKYVCAFSNSTSGTVIVGKTEKENWVGIEGQSAKECNAPQKLDTRYNQQTESEKGAHR